ncbi:hypothetical protein QE370_003054 [Aeromicrobium sp. SORGH_AS981]|uniref:hypothetical protein n=1 Tax=Aeromicrobium sp. SORGH_AS_0981 TaxID=3041802 RepID=UPI0028647A3A|nr:hypothetical protein [Aeromicrobium sp. SORGH_AS_0981]MDR6119870.1 hypothetical protein [Aeromicrobium sp. SORGH_AS_0981]
MSPRPAPRSRCTSPRAVVRVAVLGALGVGLVLSGCSRSEDEAEAAPSPSGFDVPDGVTLTDPGSTLDVGDEGTVVLDLGDGAASAVTVTVEKVRRGSIKDFRFFTLDEKSRDATPYYVNATVRNDGPAGLGGSSLPLLAHADDDVVYPASELVGRFRPCPSSALPKRFLAGASADLCFIYLLPRGTSLRSVDLQPGDAASAVRWRPKG